MTMDAPERPQVTARTDSQSRQAGVGVVVAVLVAVSFASGWRLGRRWGRLLGW